MNIKAFLLNIWYFRRNRKAKKQEQHYETLLDKLEIAIIEQAEDQKVLTAQMGSYLDQYCNLNADSEFIPRQGYSKHKIWKLIHRKFGEKMKLVNMTVTEELKVVYS